jgi:hypothetical protein
VAKIEKKEQEALKKIDKQMAALGKGVSAEAQQIYDCLAKT